MLTPTNIYEKILKLRAKEQNIKLDYEFECLSKNEYEKQRDLIEEFIMYLYEFIDKLEGYDKK